MFKDPFKAEALSGSFLKTIILFIFAVVTVVNL